MMISMATKKRLLRVTIIATVGHRIITAMTEDNIMRNGRGILSEDTTGDITVIIITGHFPDTIIITGRFPDTIIVTTPEVIIHSVMVFGCFGKIIRIRWVFKPIPIFWRFGFATWRKR